MSLSTVLFLFLAHLGVGIAFTLVFVSPEAGVKFFRFNGGLSAILLTTALAFGFNAAVPATASLKVFVASTALVVFYWATVGRLFTRIRPAILLVAVVVGLVATVLQALELSAGGSPTMQVLTVASFLTSAAILGGACTAMILGHWYLVIPSLEVSHLQSIVRGHMVSTAARILVVGLAVAFALATFRPDLAAGPGFRRYIFSLDGIFFWQRVFFGLVGPAVLSPLTWETAKIRSTQSATGILYVDFFTVVVGEVLAKYILLATRVPV